MNKRPVKHPTVKLRNLTSVAALCLICKCVAAPAQTAACDERCLDGVMDQYLAALVKRDPSRLPTAPGVRFTENSRELKLGDGLWRTATGLGPYKQELADVKAGEAGLFATVLENDVLQWMTVRLKVVDHKITEIETLVLRQQISHFMNTSATAPKPIFDEVLQPSERRTREELVAAVNPYFDGLNKGDGNMVPFSDACNRVENGNPTTNVKTAGTTPMFPDHPNFNLAAMGCRDQFNTGMVKYIQEVSPRRTVIVNEEKGLVFGFYMFRHPGDLTEVNVPGVGRTKMFKAALYPFDVLVSELFKLKDGKIQEIEAIMVQLPYRSDTGWDKAR